MQNKPKKTPIKGEPIVKTTNIKGTPAKKVKEVVPKVDPPCSLCGKRRLIAIKSKKICAVCNKKKSIEAQKEKNKVKRKKKAETITQIKLDQITSKLVRTLYPSICPHCFVKLDNSNSNCGHFVSRTKQSTRFSLKNLVSIDRNCNFYKPEHVYTLGKTLNNLWGEGTADNQILLGNRHVKFSNQDRKEIFDIYLNALQKAESHELNQDEKYELLKETQILYEEIVNNLIQ
jgi:hypothetical protein